MFSETNITEELKNLRFKRQLISKKNEKLLKRFNQSSEAYNVTKNEDYNVIKGMEESKQKFKRNSFFDKNEALIVNNCFEKSVQFLKYQTRKKRKCIYGLFQSIQESNSIFSSNFSNSQSNSNSKQQHEPVFKQRKMKPTEKFHENKTCTSYIASDFNMSCHEAKITKPENKTFNRKHPNKLETIIVLNRNEESILNTDSNILKNKSPKKKLATISVESVNNKEQNECIDLCHIQDDQDCLILPSSLPEKNTKLKYSKEEQHCNSVSMSIERKKRPNCVDSTIPIIDISDPEVIFVTSHKAKTKCPDNSCDSQKFQTEKSQKNNLNFITKESSMYRNCEKYKKNSEVNSIHVGKVNSCNMNNTSVITKKNNLLEESSINHTTDSEIVCMDMSLEESYLNESNDYYNCNIPVWDFKEEPVDFPVPRLHLYDTLHPPLSKQELDLLKSEGIKINYGKWTKEEENLLKRNYENFASQFGVNNVHLLLGIGRRIAPTKCEHKNIKKFLKAKHFYVRLGKDINHRTLTWIYMKARKLLNPLKSNVVSNIKDFKLIERLQKKYGNNWQIIGYKLGKCPYYCGNCFYNFKNSSQRGKWSDAEIEKLINGIKSVTKSVDLNLENLKGTISWEKVSDFVSTRSHSQCKNKWAAINKNIGACKYKNKN